MRRYFITRGAKTTAGGTVIGGLPGHAIKQADIALEGHEVLCPACATTGNIVCVGPRLEQWARGRRVALSDDICRCQCDPAPRLVANQFERGQTVATTTPAQARTAPEKNPPQTSAAERSTVHISAPTSSSAKLNEMIESGCERDWWFYQKQAENIIAPGGNLIADPRLRNRIINSAYAQLWRLDPRFQWAGLAAFASKQVGCGLLHASDSIEKIQAQYEAAEHLRRSAKGGIFGLFSADEHERRAKLQEYERRLQDYEEAERNNPLPGIDLIRDGEGLSVVQQLYKYVYEKLAMGNTTLFLDVFPLHAFYKERGLELLARCLPLRTKIQKGGPTSMLWPVGHEKLEFGANHGEILQAFEAIEKDDITKGVEYLAIHEQKNILQSALYNDRKLVTLLRSNHLSFVTDIPSGAAQAIELTLANQCRPVDDGRTISFSSHPFANLADIDQRMAFVIKAAAQFDRLLNGTERHLIEQAIKDIAEGQAVQ